MFDVDAFFDSIDVPVLAAQCLEENSATQIFPLEDAVAGAFAEPTVGTSKSILARCSASMTLARLYLKNAVAEVSRVAGLQRQKMLE